MYRRCLVCLVQNNVPMKGGHAVSKGLIITDVGSELLPLMTTLIVPRLYIEFKVK